MPRDEGDHLLGGLCSLWVEKIRKARDLKKKAFQDDADEAMLFYRPPEDGYNFVYRGDLKASKGIGIDQPEPAFKMTLNKVAELVEIFGPILYARNPVRQVNPRAPFLQAEPQGGPVPGRDPGHLLLADPALWQKLLPPGLPPQVLADPTFPQLFVSTLVQQEVQRSADDAMKSALIEKYLNFTPDELRLKDHAERGIDEALIKGRGCLWSELYTPPGSTTRLVGSFFDSVDFLQVDPDAEHFSDAWWIARECCHPAWEVERKYGLEPGSLKATMESSGMAAEVDSQKKEHDRAKGMTSDLVRYWQVYSRMGCGGRLSGSDPTVDVSRHGLLPGDLAGYAATLDPITGDFVYLVIAPGCDYPLNLPPAVQAMPLAAGGQAEIRKRLAWPVPYWADGTWPVSVLDFHPVPRSPWPMSHIKPAMGELRFLCWAYSFMAGKIRSTLRDVVAILKEMAEEFKMQVLEGADMSVVELDTQNRDIKECVQVLQFPQMNADVWKVIEAVENNFEKRVGLNEIFYGKSATQDRSATESSLKSQHLNIRPDDMGERVESWMTEIARKEAVAARMLLTAEDVAPILGPVAAQLWTSLVTTPPGDLSAFRELEYRIEAGSTKKPNRDRDMANADSAMQTLMPILNQFAAGTGQLGPVNALIGYWAKTRDIEAAPFLLPSPPPMSAAPPAPGPGQGPAGPPSESPPPGPPGPPGAPS